MFLTILTFCTPNQLGHLWEQFHHHLCSDLKHRLQVPHDLENLSEHDVHDYGLFSIDETLKDHYNISLCDILGLPQSIIHWVIYHPNPFIVEQLNWNHENLISIV